MTAPMIPGLPRPAPRLGAHVSIAGGLERALTRGLEAGCDVVQVFTRSNQQWAARPIGADDAERWRATLAATGVDAAMAHGCYPRGFCSIASQQDCRLPL